MTDRIVKYLRDLSGFSVKRFTWKDWLIIGISLVIAAVILLEGRCSKEDKTFKVAATDRSQKLWILDTRSTK